MKEAGFAFSVRKPGEDESFPETMPAGEVPRYLAEKKASSVEPKPTGQEIILASDTVVVLGGQILNKPNDREEAIDMLSRLSGKTHSVITAVCLLGKSGMDCFDDTSKVTFKKLSPDETAYYVDHFHPYDKAGAYGAQECLPDGMAPCSPEELEFLKSINRLDLIDKTLTGGQAGKKVPIIEKIEGSYFTVMGLPIHKVHAHLQLF